MSTIDLWTFDAADPDVGLFGDLVIHECAENDAAEDCLPANITDVTRRSNGPDLVDEHTTFTCPACGETKVVVESYPRSWFEE